MSINKKLTLILIFLIILILGSSQVIKHSAKYQTEQKQNKTTSAAVESKAGLPYAFLNNVIAQSGAACSVYYKSLANNELFYNYSGQMPAGQLIRVFVLAKAQEAIEQGELKPEEPVTVTKELLGKHSPALKEEPVGAKVPLSVLLEKMLTVNDDTAANLVIDLLGRDEINAFIQKHGYVDTVLAVPEEAADSAEGAKPAVRQTDYTSVNDLMNFYASLYQGKCVSAAADQRMLAILKQQRDATKLRTLLPKDTVFAHASAALPGIQNDGGIVYGKEPYILIVMTAKSVDEARTLKTINQISSIIYNSVADKEVFKK